MHRNIGNTMSSSPRDIIANSKMTSAQVYGVGICMILNALDGFDVLSISFAAPGISQDWSLNKSLLGVLLATELVGMTLGSLLLGNLADRIGRRPLILFCITTMAAGMLSAALAPNLTVMIIVRFFTGIGIGGMLASINAMSAEYANKKNRTFAVSMMAVGYPLGAMIGGIFATILLSYYSWRSVFLLGGTLTALMWPVVWFGLPESIEYLERKRPRNALERINKILQRMGHKTVDKLPPLSPVPSGDKPSLLSKGFLPVLILMTIGYFAHMTSFYFLVKWIPKLVVEMGFNASNAGSVLVWTNAGGAVGSLLFGFLSKKFDLKVLVVTFLILSGASILAFGQGSVDLTTLSAVSALAGFFTTATIVGLYGFIVKIFPTEYRAGCTGLVIGFGRGGAVLGPIIGGVLLDQGLGLPAVATVMMFGPLIAAICYFFARTPQQYIKSS